MNDLTEQLYAAASAAPDELGLSLPQVRRRGARRRRIRTSALAGAAVIAVAAGTYLFSPAAPPVSPVVAAPASPSPSTTDLPAVPDQAIDTTTDVGGGTAAFWVIPKDGALLLAVGRHLADSRYELVGVTRATGDVRAAGFHATGELLVGPARFLCGYVVGPDVATVRLTLQGSPVTASTAPWPADPTLHVWWYAVPSTPQAGEVRALSAAGAVVAQAPVRTG
jgi:hypothetical protein